MNKDSILQSLYDSIGQDLHGIESDKDIAHVEIHQNKVLGMNLVPGLEIEATERRNGIEASIKALKGVRIAKPVQICFGVVPEKGLQEITLDIEIEDDAAVEILAHCTFPNAEDVRHVMDARIKVGRGASYSYFERHVHGNKGGVEVVPKTEVEVLENGVFKTEFELIKGRVGSIDIDLDATCHKNSVMDITARMDGREDDRIEINERGRLIGEGARGVLKSSIAVRDRAVANIRNSLTASAAYARGHVDCKEIVQGDAIAKAVPIVEVNHPKAHVTHEAALGSVDSKQLETLMSRGLDEDAATDLIIQGLLS